MALCLLQILCLLLFQHVHKVLSQQLLDSLPSEPSWPNITTACFQALNTTVSCPGFLHSVSMTNERLTSDELGALCTDGCYSSLTTVRKNIVDGCKGSTDFIQFFDGVNYPATFVVDHYIHAYDIACMKDPASKQFCNTMMIQWLSNTNWTKEMQCHDCTLGTQQIRLNSPFDFTEEFAEDFASRTSSCGSTQYSYTTPPPYVIGTKTSDAPVSTPTCANTYTVQKTDTCDSIAVAQNVSTYSITSRNSLFSDCSNLALIGTICVPDKCKIYQIQRDDTCDSILEAQRADISGSQFLAWNPNINALCSNIGSLRQTYICLSPPGGVLAVPTPSVSMPMTEPTAPVPRPTNSFPESNEKCGKWYNITKSDTCEKVSVLNSISLKDLYFLNPEINAQCTNLLLGVSYCVQPIGDIQTYPNYPKTTNFITMTSNTYTTSTSEAPIKLPFPTRATTSNYPHATGTLENCYKYQNYRDIPPIVDQSQSTEPALFTNFINTCSYVESAYSVNIDDLLKWNTSLDFANCTMKPGFSYCVLQNKDYKYNRPEYISPCFPVDPSIIPGGTISTCACYSEVSGDDWPDYAETCEGLVEELRIDAANVPKWNPWVGSNCDEGLYAGLAPNKTRAVCIGVMGA